MTVYARVSGAIGLALLAGACQSVPANPPGKSTTAAARSVAHIGAAASDAPTPVAASAGQSAAAAPQSGPLVRQYGTGAMVGRASAAAPALGAKGDISLNYVDTDLREIIRVILGDTLHLNYAIDPRFQGNATIQTATPLKREDLLPTLNSLIEQDGGEMLYQGGVFRIMPAGNTLIVPPIVSPASDSAGSQVVPLRYASAKQLATMLTPYVGDGAQLIADPTRNVLIVNGSAAARQSVIDLVRIFDVDYLAGQSYALFPVKSGEPDKVATDLQHALGADADGPLAGTIRIVPIMQANAIMVIAQQPAYLDRAARLIEQLDTVTEETGRSVHVYHLRNAQATDLQPVLQTAFNPPGGGAGTAGGKPGSLPPTSTPAQVSASSSGAPAGGLGTSLMQTGQTGLPTASGGQSGTNGETMQIGQSATPASPPEQAPTPVAAAPGAPEIIADPKGNSLIIVATEDEYPKIESAVRQLDVLPPEVLVEATIAEVTLNKALQYGTQFYFNNAEATATLSNAQSATPTTIGGGATNGSLFGIPTFAPGFPGLAVTRFVGSQQYALEALENVTEVHVISAPKILILDKQPAMIQVGSLVPIITQSAVSVATAGAPVVNSVQYEPTGIILDVTPQIGTGGLVSLDIDQQVSDVVNTTSSTINSPSFDERRIKSRVVVEDGQTIGLAGLISDNKSNGNGGIPVLRSIPVLGALFSTQDNSDLRQELIVLITPHIVHDEREARAMTEELKKKLAQPAALVP